MKNILWIIGIIAIASLLTARRFVEMHFGISGWWMVLILIICWLLMDIIIYIQKKKLKKLLDSMSEDELESMETSKDEIAEYKEKPDLRKDIFHTLRQLSEIIVLLTFSFLIIMIEMAIRKKEFSWSRNLDVIDIMTILLSFALYALIRCLISKKLPKQKKR